jgi:hypothetical protein
VKEQPQGARFSTYEKCGLIVRVVVGEDGQPLFTEADIPVLMGKSATVIDRLFDIGASGIDVGNGPVPYLQTLTPDKLIRALVDRGDSDAEILAAIEGDELKWWFDRLVSSPAECRALLAELRPQPSSGEGKPEPGDEDRAAERKSTRPSRTPELHQIAQEVLARGETIDNATDRPIPVGPLALGEPGGPQSRSLYLYENLGVPWNRAHLMTTALGGSAREALAQLIEADAANGEGYFVIVRPNGARPLVAKGQFRGEVSGEALLELEGAGVLMSNSRDADRLKTFYLASDSRQLLEAAIAAAGEPTPLSGTPTSVPGPALINTRDEVEAKRADRHGATRGPGRPPWTAELFWTRYQQALGSATPPYTYSAIAPYFETLDGNRGTDPEYLRKLVRRYGLTPE